MADKAISQLTQATQITATDLFVLQQSNEAKSLPGQVLLNWLTAAADGHGGISTITGPTTSGLVDTYTITYADTTTSTFTVTNGEKGDTGDPGDTWYTHIRYSARDPVSDSDIKTQADDWMGIYSGTSSTAPTTYTSYTWFKIKGETGDTGTSITSVTKTGTSGLVDTYTVVFSDSTSTTFTVTNGSSIQSIAKTGTSGLTDTYTVTLTNGSTTTFTVANGKGITSITNVDVTHAAGHTDEYRMNFNDGDTFTFYVYNGTNGTGSVSTVDGIQAVNQNVDLLTVGSGAPTTSTPGSIKSRYFDTATSILYICIGVDSTGPETTYTWAGAGVTVDSTFSTMSTNPLQNAVLTNKIGTGTLETTAQNIIAAINEVAADADEALTVFEPATSNSAGTKGAVPAPQTTADNAKFLRGDATWGSVPTPLMSYPIGSIYISVDSTSPASLFGGTWERIEGKFLLAATDNGATGTNILKNASVAAGSTGGEAAHQLGTSELPAHVHSPEKGGSYLAINVTSGSEITAGFASGNNWTNMPKARSGSGSVGNNDTHNTMPPFLAVYMWKRLS